MWSWGSNTFGGLGQGLNVTNVNSPIISSPQRIGTNTNWVLLPTNSCTDFATGFAVADLDTSTTTVINTP
jgi:hypothetical protein